jgi:hypothetical protein
MSRQDELYGEMRDHRGHIEEHMKPFIDLSHKLQFDTYSVLDDLADLIFDSTGLRVTIVQDEWSEGEEE